MITSDKNLNKRMMNGTLTNGEYFYYYNKLDKFKDMLILDVKLNKNKMYIIIN